VGDSEARFRRPHGTALCGERRKRGPDLACDPSDIYVNPSAEQLRAAVQRRQGPGSSDGRFVTLRVCHWMAVGIQRIRGRTSAAKPCVCIAAKCGRLRQREGDALGRFVRSASGTCVWRILAGCDPLARKRPAKRTKARAPSEHSSAITATSRRERPRSSSIHNEQRKATLVDSNKQVGDSNKQGVCPRLFWVEDVPLRTFSKLAFYWSASAITKQIWKAYENP